MKKIFIGVLELKGQKFIPAHKNLRHANPGEAIVLGGVAWKWTGTDRTYAKYIILKPLRHWWQKLF